VIKNPKKTSKKGVKNTIWGMVLDLRFWGVLTLGFWGARRT